MLFGKRRKLNPSQRPGRKQAGTASRLNDSFYIDYDMMVKGSEVTRGRNRVRQYAIMVGSAIRLVTSGDTVDRPTYEALVSAGVVAPPKQTGDEDNATGETPGS